MSRLPSYTCAHRDEGACVPCEVAWLKRKVESLEHDLLPFQMRLEKLQPPASPEPTIPISEHQRLQAEAAAMRRALVRTKEFAAYVLDTESHWHECEQKPDDPLDPPNENCNCQVGIIAGIDAALSSDAGKGWVSPEEHEKTEAACARYREALEGMLRLYRGSYATPESVAARAALSSSDAGAALLEEVQGLRRERDELLALAYVGDIRSPDLTWKSRAMGNMVRVEQARAESADLRSRLETAEKDAAEWKQACMESRTRISLDCTRHASEVRRAVEEEREALVAIIERDVSNSHVARHLIESVRARSRGGA